MSAKTILINSLNENLSFDVKENDMTTFFLLLIGSQNSEGKVTISIKGENTSVKILGIVIGKGSQVIRLSTLQDHFAPLSKSDLLIKSVLLDGAKFFYQGLIRIEKNAQKSNAYQKNQNLLIGTRTWADSRPSLEILANDVRCTHGATIGRIDEAQLYYLSTRGLSSAGSKRLLIEGFLNDVIERIPTDRDRVFIAKKVTQTLREQEYN